MTTNPAGGGHPSEGWWWGRRAARKGVPPPLPPGPHAADSGSGLLLLLFREGSFGARPPPHTQSFLPTNPKIIIITNHKPALPTGQALSQEPQVNELILMDKETISESLGNLPKLDSGRMEPGFDSLFYQPLVSCYR